MSRSSRSDGPHCLGSKTNASSFPITTGHTPQHRKGNAWRASLRRPFESTRMTQANKLFGTDGVRGVANVEPVTAETALKLGRAAAHVFKNLEAESRGRGKHKIVIGKD